MPVRGLPLVNSGRRTCSRSAGSSRAYVTAPQSCRRSWCHGEHLRRVARRATGSHEDPARGLRALHERDDSARLPAGLVPRLRRILFRLQEATHPDSAAAPGFQMHPLTGGRAGRKEIHSVRPKTGDFAVVRCRRRVFSRRILRRVGIFSKKSSPSRAENTASRDVGGLRATPKRPTSRVGYQNKIRPRLRGHQTSSTASTRLASQTLSFSTLQ